MTTQSNKPENEEKDLVKVAENAFGVKLSTLRWFVLAVAVLTALAFIFTNWDVNRPDTGRMGDAKKAAETLPEVKNPVVGLNTGDMATFVVAKRRKRVPKISFADVSGTEHTLKEFSGKVLLLNIWATWCAPCRHEMPALDRLEAELGGDDFAVLPISIDRGGIAKPKRFFEQIKIKSLGLYIDASGGKLATQLRALGMPTTLLISKDGYELGRLAGPAKWDSDTAKALVNAALGRAGVSGKPAVPSSEAPSEAASKASKM